MKMKDVLSEYERSCILCEHSTPLNDGTCLCQKKGIVPETYKCRSFCFDITKIKFDSNRVRINDTECETV
ncbi:MAG: hypothetical protein E7665_02765 [Ruminococcaceae bacterium]|nr:hypothetical protein [Oscillospiraceae bacterium]